MIAREEIHIIVKDNLEKEIKRLKELDRKVDSTSKSVGGIGTAFKGLINPITIGAAAIAGIGYSIKKAVGSASDFVEANNRLKVVFKGLEKESKGAMSRLRNEYHLSRQAATEYLSSIGDILTGFSLSKESSLELSEEVVKLSTDLSSFANIPVEQAVSAITKSFTGEREELKSLGVVLTEELVKGREQIVQQRLLKEGFKGTAEQLQRTARSYATFELIQEQSVNAIGDFNRSLDESLPNQWKVLQNNMNDVAVSLGQTILPLVLSIASSINGWFDNDTDKLTKSIKKNETLLLESQKRGDKEGERIAKAGLDRVKNETKELIKELDNPILETDGFNSSGKASKVNQSFSSDAVQKMIEDQKHLIEASEGSRIEEMRKISTGESKKSLIDLDVEAQDEEKRLKELQEYLAKVVEYEERLGTLKSTLNKLDKGKVESTSSSSSDSGKIKEKKTKSNAKEILAIYKANEKEKSTATVEALEERIKEVETLERRYALNKANLTNKDEIAIADNAVAVKQAIQERIKEVETKAEARSRKLRNKKLEGYKSTFSQIADIAGNAMGVISQGISQMFNSELSLLERNYNRKRELLEAETAEEAELRELKQAQEEEDFLNKYGIEQEKYLAMDDLAQANFEQKQTRADKQELLELKAKKAREERDKEILKQEKAHAEATKQVKSKQFEAEKGMNIASIIMATARAVVGALGQLPFTPANIAFSAVVGGLGAAQLGVAASQKNPYAYSKGGIAKSPQMALLGEAGPEMILPANLTKMILEGKSKDLEAPVSEDTPTINNTKINNFVTTNNIEDFDYQNAEQGLEEEDVTS